MNETQPLAEYKVGLGMAKLTVYKDHLNLKKLTSQKNIPVKSISHIEVKKWTMQLVLHISGGVKEEIQLSQGNSLQEAENLINSLIISGNAASVSTAAGNENAPASSSENFTSSETSSNSKKGIIIGATILLLIFLSSIIGGSTSSKNQSNVAAQQQNQTEPLNEKDQIKKLVSDQLQGNNNMGKPYIREINVVEQVDGGWGVFVEYNAGDNLTRNLRKGGIEKNMSEIYIALYTSSKDVRSASVTAYFPSTDGYGNENETVVYKTVLEKSEAEKINWNADPSMLKLRILPGVWTTTLLHPEFK